MFLLSTTALLWLDQHLVSIGTPSVLRQCLALLEQLVCQAAPLQSQAIHCLHSHRRDNSTIVALKISFHMQMDHLAPRAIPCSHVCIPDIPCFLTSWQVSACVYDWYGMCYNRMHRHQPVTLKSNQLLWCVDYPKHSPHPSSSAHHHEKRCQKVAWGW